MTLPEAGKIEESLTKSQSLVKASGLSIQIQNLEVIKVSLHA